MQQQKINRSQALQLTAMDMPSPGSIQQEDEDALRNIFPDAVVTTLLAKTAPAVQGIPDGYRIRFDAAQPNCIHINGLAIQFSRIQAQMLRRLADEINVCVEYDILLNDVWTESIGERKQASRQKIEICKRVERALGRKPDGLIQTTPGVGLALIATLEDDAMG